MVFPLCLVSGMDVDKMDESDWNYHGEGNRSLVVAHVQHSRVLRLLKNSAQDSENAPQTPEQAYRQLQNMVDFCKNVMAPLLGDKFIHSGEVVKLPLEFVRQLSIKIQHQRPAWRCDKVLDVYSGCALLLPNLTSPSPTHSTHTPPLCIEIKPKCGFLPTSRHISKDIKTRVCRYCLHQHYKVANGKWKRHSLYCPLDLFSGNRQRMHFAIKHLIEEPQNNLKIFKGGQCIYGDQASGDLHDVSWLLQQLRPYFLYGSSRTNGHLGNKAILNDFIQVLLNALLSGGEGEQEEDEETVEGRSVCEASLVNRELVRHGSHGLPRNSVLSRVLQVQMLDTLDIEGLFPLYRRLDQYSQDYPKDRTSLQVDGPYNEIFLEKVQKCSGEDDGSVEYAAAKVHQYRVAMTAKDCSIMVCLVPRSDEEDDEGMRRQRDQSRGSGFWSWVSVLDLDPKPVCSVPRQLRLDHKIVSYYLRPATALPKGTLPQQRDRDECTLVFHPV